MVAGHANNPFGLRWRIYAVALLAVTVSPLCFGHASAAPQVARLPPMGWNSWNYFGTTVTEADVRAAAKAMVTSGMRAAGYRYVIIDDSWAGKRNASGHIVPNKKFPDMKALADYIHSLGLKFGIYSSPGPKTCADYTGSYGHVRQDAETYASWGVDYLKYDLCSYDHVMRADAPHNAVKRMQMMRTVYQKMGSALRATGRPIVYALCQYGLDSVWTWGSGVGGNMWRTTGDIKPAWNRIRTIVSMQEGLAPYAGPGHWNNPDMLEVGNGDLSLSENRSHFAWWAMLAAPLIAGNDLATMRPAVKKILTNRRVIAVDQDPLGRQGSRVYMQGEVAVWARHLQHGALAIAVFNLGNDRTAANPFHVDLEKLGLHGPQKGENLWTGRPITLTGASPIELSSHDVLLVRIAHPR